MKTIIKIVLLSLSLIALPFIIESSTQAEEPDAFVRRSTFAAAEDNRPTIRVLSLDGGGIRGVIPAYLLSRIEQLTGQPISAHFDLIAGTSTGGILALGLSVPA